MSQLWVCKPGNHVQAEVPCVSTGQGFHVRAWQYSVSKKDSWTVYTSTNTPGHVQYIPHLQTGMVIVKSLMVIISHLTNTRSLFTSVHKLTSPQSLFFRKRNYRLLHQKGLVDSQEQTKMHFALLWKRGQTLSVIGG